jgi:glutathione S-transferase
MTLKLHCFGESGHSFKVAMALNIAKLDWEAVYVDFFNGQGRSPEFRSDLNVMGESPVLQDGDLTLTQSGVILDYISEKTGKFGGSTPEEKREVLRWVLWDNHKMSSQVGLVRFMKNFIPEEKRSEEVIAFLTGRATAALAILNTALEGRDWLVGSSVTAADFSCSGYLFYPEDLGFDRTDYPNIDAWLTRISELDGWKHPYEMMPGSPADRM